jgi:hypothetical protein
MNTKEYCVFFKTLDPELQERVKQICENAENKSKIYTNIDNVIKILENDGDIIRSVLKSQSFGRSFTSLKDQKRDLDAVLQLYKSSNSLRKNIDNDYFFSRFLINCIKYDNALKTKTPRTANIELLKYEGAEKYDTDTENNKSGDNSLEQYLGGEKKSKRHRKSKRYIKRKTCRKSK